jgi:Domain of unknown function (DUF4157)
MTMAFQSKAVPQRAVAGCSPKYDQAATGQLHIAGTEPAATASARPSSFPHVAQDADGTATRSLGGNGLAVSSQKDSSEVSARRTTDSMPVQSGRPRGPGSRQLPGLRPSSQPVIHRAMDPAAPNAGCCGELTDATFLRLPGIQPKLRLSQPEDSSEHEADDIADYVINAAQRRGVDSTIHNEVSGPPGDAAIPVAVRDVMESHFGGDFSGVRIHHDPAANDLANKLNARAFTAGRDIFFGPDQFAPASEGGKRLIAHELAHVMQQGAAGPLVQHKAIAVGGADLMRQAEEAQPAQMPTPEMTTETTNTETEPDEEGTQVESGMDEIWILLAALTTFTAGGFPDAATPRIDRQGKRPATKAQGAPKPSGVTVESVQVLPDQEGDVPTGKAAVTKPQLTPTYTVVKKKDKDGTVKSFQVNVSRTIQTTYKKGVSKTSTSAYGRGTTTADKAAGNTTLQFHESSHVADNKDYLDKNKLPEFTGKEGMTAKEFEAAFAKYGEDLRKYIKGLEDASTTSTDCVGVPESSCPAPTPPPAPSAPPPTPPPAPSAPPPTPPPAPSKS